MIEREVMDEKGISLIISRLASEIVERNSDGIKSLVMIGIRTRGVPLAHRLGEKIGGVPVGVLDINLYRDDLTTISHQPIIRETEIPFDINEKRIILVDDVLYTGRTVRCALDELVDFGRPKTIQLAVLVDRGHRELPIQADFIGTRISTSSSEFVKVKLKEVDGCDRIIVLRKE
jgi:pyrimidine operon attenuation protein/uracil phosphoribosyltransferase